MNRIALPLAIVVLLAGAACRRASDAEVDEGIRLYNELWDGYFKTLEDNQADPDRMLAAGQKFIDDNQDQLARVKKIMSMNGSEAQRDRVARADQEMTAQAERRLGEIVKGLQARPELSVDGARAIFKDIQRQALALARQMSAE